MHRFFQIVQETIPDKSPWAYQIVAGPIWDSAGNISASPMMALNASFGEADFYF